MQTLHLKPELEHVEKYRGTLFIFDYLLYRMTGAPPCMPVMTRNRPCIRSGSKTDYPLVPGRSYLQVFTTQVEPLRRYGPLIANVFQAPTCSSQCLIGSRPPMGSRANQRTSRPLVGKLSVSCCWRCICNRDNRSITSSGLVSSI